MTASGIADVRSETAVHGREAFLDAIEDVLFGSVSLCHSPDISLLICLRSQVQ